MAPDSSNDPAAHEVTELLRPQGDGETLEYGDSALLHDKMRTRSLPSLPARLGRYRITNTLDEGDDVAADGRFVMIKLADGAVLPFNIVLDWEATLAEAPAH